MNRYKFPKIYAFWPIQEGLRPFLKPFGPVLPLFGGLRTLWTYPGILRWPFGHIQGCLEGLIGLHKGVQRPFWTYPRDWEAFCVNTRGIWNPLSLSRGAWRALSTYTGGSGAIFGLSSGPQGPFWTYPGGSETILHISREVRRPLGL